MHAQEPVISGMQKTPAHWKAAHPILFIVAELGLGIWAGTYLTLPINVQPKIASISMVVVGILVVCCIQLKKLPDHMQSLTLHVALLLWGMAIYFATHNQDMISIPYPELWIERMRNWILQKLDICLKNQAANGFAKALLLGVKSNMDKDLVKAYKELGVIHIIAISGMHLEILFKNMTRITHWLPRKKYFLWLELFLVLIVVWAYTLMAFASPSIVRASVFFSIYSVGKFFKQPIYVLNVIAAGMLLLLLLDVKDINNVGLQLSYAAVLGIHFFYPLFLKLFPMDNPVLSFLWSNCCITIAAQITTFPILAYHFHQISTMVLVSNCIMVPLSNILLYALAILLLTPNFGGCSLFFGHWVERYLLFINQLVLQNPSRNLSKMAATPFSLYWVIIYYVTLFLAYLWVIQKKSTYLYISCWFITLSILIKLFSNFTFLWKI
jgi:competence protein ComEC